jgi:hypothetical protein
MAVGKAGKKYHKSIGQGGDSTEQKWKIFVK